ncbi:MAG TPA: hypothetical protein PLQ04_03460 [Lachnospiraceae bacterium]|nr:hypothetical protein [Lachnospiraceae bacterium]
MDTTYELVKATRGFLQGHLDDFRRIFELSVDDMYFQMQFIICDEEQIDQELEKLYINVIQNFFMMEAPENIAEWMNETVTQFTSDWLRTNRRDMLMAENRGAYAVPMVSEVYIPGNDMEDMEFTKMLENFLCTLPEIHRQTALAYYYNNLSMDKLVDILMLEASAVKRRTSYIEKNLILQMEEFCKEHNYRTRSLNSQKILMALVDLQKLYRFQRTESLYNSIRMKAIH